MHLSFFMSFHGLIVHFFLALSNFLLSGCTTVLVIMKNQSFGSYNKAVLAVMNKGIIIINMQFFEWM